MGACIRKPDHRVKFKKAQRKRTHTAAPSLSVIPEATTQLRETTVGVVDVSGIIDDNRTESRTTERGEDRRKPINTIQKQDNANTGSINITTEEEKRTATTASEPIDGGDERRKPLKTARKAETAETDTTNAAGEVDRTYIDEAVGGMMEVSGIIDDNGTKTNPDATTSVASRNEVSRFGEMTLQSSDNDMSKTTEFAGMDLSRTVIDGTGASTHKKKKTKEVDLKLRDGRRKSKRASKQQRQLDREAKAIGKGPLQSQSTTTESHESSGIMELIDDVGTPGTFISDDIITKAAEILEKSELNDSTFYINNFKPSVQQLYLSEEASTIEHEYLKADKPSINFLLIHNHWLTVMFQPDSKPLITIYDSLATRERKSSILPLVKKMYRNIGEDDVQYVPITQQEKDPACACYAVAAAIEILKGRKPEQKQFDRAKMREHLRKILLEEKPLVFLTTGLRCLNCRPWQPVCKQHLFETAFPIVSGSVKGDTNFRDYLRSAACGVINGKTNGRIRIQNRDFDENSKHQGKDDFLQQIEPDLKELSDQTNMEYYEVFSNLDWEEGKFEYFLIDIKGINGHCYADLNLYEALHSRVDKVDKSNMNISLTSISGYTPAPQLSQRKDLVLDEILESGESIGIQYKCYQADNKNTSLTDQSLISKLSKKESGLPKYMSAFARQSNIESGKTKTFRNGGNFYAGVYETKGKDRKQRNPNETLSETIGTVYTVKGQNIDKPEDIKKGIENIICNKMCWVTREGTVLEPEAIKQYYKIQFLPVMDKHGNHIAGEDGRRAYVIEVAVAYFNGYAFASSDGPKVFFIASDGSVVKHTVTDWYNWYKDKMHEVIQGPTQLYTAPEADETNNPVAILKGQMEMLADSYRSKDRMFVETKAFNELKTVVEEMHWATLLGKPGDGKSATAAHLLLQYTDRGYDPVFLSSPRDWKMLIYDSPSSRQVVMIDDMFGQSYLDDNNNVGKWKSLIESMSRIVKQRNGKLIVICTSRKHIFKDIETALSKHACLLKHAIVDMTEEHFKLTGDEKVAILNKFVEDNKIETTQLLLRDIYYVDPPHGFPHCVELYCTNIFLRNEGIAFFKNPVQYVQREICNFKDNDRVKFLVLLLVLHNGEKLGPDTLDRLTEHTTDDDKKLFRTAGVSVETAIPDIQRALTGLTNTYLKQNQDGSYSFSHNSLRENVAFIYISTNPLHAIKALEFHHIAAFFRTKKKSLPYEPLAKRMITELQNRHVTIVCSCHVWNDEAFVSTFLKSIENESLAFLETIICSEGIRDDYVFPTVSLLGGLIYWTCYCAAISIIENETIQKTLQHSDKWKNNLQKGLECACLGTLQDSLKCLINPQIRLTNSNMALIRALVSVRYGKNSLKLDGSKLLSEMLSRSKADEAIILIDNTHISPRDRHFHALAGSSIDLPQFEVLCKKLVDAGVDINQTDGFPAVFQCLTRDNGWIKLVCMVKYGANIHTHCKYGDIVTFIAGHTDLNSSSKLCILKQLSDFGVDIRCTGINGSNAIHHLCSTKPDDGSHTLLEYLLDKGVNAKAANKDGVVPLMLALKNNFSIDIIQTLAKSSPSNHVDKYGQGYFYYLMSSKWIIDMYEFCEILIKLDLFMNGNDNEDKSLNVNLMGQRRITQTGCDLVQRFQFLHENGIDLHAKDCHGRNIVLCVLDWELTENVLPVLQYFHSIEIDLKLTDNDGRNALHHLFANTVYIDKYIGRDMISDHMYDVTKREFPEAAGNMLKEIYDFLTDIIGLHPTIGDKNGINPVMLALKNCAGFSWISGLLKQDIPLLADNKGRNYFHYLAESCAPDDKFEALKTMLLDKVLNILDKLRL